MNVRIRKRSFFEISLPLMVLAFLGQGTVFINISHLPDIRFVLLFVIFSYFFLNRKIFAYIENQYFIFFLISYLLFCVTSSLWSEIPFLSFSKSVAFLFAVITLVTAGCAWVVKFGYRRSLDWVFPVLIITLISGLFGGKADCAVSGIITYGGLSGNANNFGFLAAMVFPLILWRCYCAKENKRALFFLVVILIMDIKFLFSSYSRSSIAILLCVILFFVISLSLSKKIVITFGSIFSIIFLLVMMPVSLLENMAMKHVIKWGDVTVKGPVADQVLSSREEVWQQSFNNAIKGGIMGAGFFATIGDTNYKVGQAWYGREKGNSQLAILEETGVIGLLLSSIVIALFFYHAFFYYPRFNGDEKVMLGLVLGSMCGLLVESFVEAWWDSLGPEVVCFWMLVGVVFGLVYMKKQGRLT
jgi:hypothetical protein